MRKADITQNRTPLTVAANKSASTLYYIIPSRVKYPINVTLIPNSAIIDENKCARVNLYDLTNKQMIIKVKKTEEMLMV